jgi:hypothetical protein
MIWPNNKEPIAHGSAAIWNRHKTDAEKTSIHILSVVVARSVHLLRLAVAAYW